MKRKRKFAALALLLILSMMSSLVVHAAPKTADDFKAEVAALPRDHEITEKNITEVQAAITTATATYNSLTDKSGVTAEKATLDKKKKIADYVETLLSTTAQSKKEVKIDRVGYVFDPETFPTLSYVPAGQTEDNFKMFSGEEVQEPGLIEFKKEYLGPTDYPKFEFTHEAGKYGYTMPSFTDLLDDTSLDQAYLEAGTSPEEVDPDDPSYDPDKVITQESVGTLNAGYEVAWVNIDGVLDIVPDEDGNLEGFVFWNDIDNTEEHHITYHLKPKFEFSIKYDWAEKTQTNPTVLTKFPTGPIYSAKSTDTYKIDGISDSLITPPSSDKELKGWTVNGTAKDLGDSFQVMNQQEYTIKPVYGEKSSSGGGTSGETPTPSEEWDLDIVYTDGSDSTEVFADYSTTATFTTDPGSYKIGYNPSGAPEGKKLDYWKATYAGITKTDTNKYHLNDTVSVPKGCTGLTLTAQWTDVGSGTGSGEQWTAKVIFDGNHEDASESSVSKKGTGDTISIQTTSYVEAPSGKSFKEWNTKADGTGTKYANGDTISVKKDTPTVTLYAIWQDGGAGTVDKWTATITYFVNGGTGSIAAQTAEGTASNLEVAVSNGSGISRSDYSFAGWNTKADGTGTAYAASAKIVINKSAPTVELYAQWKKVNKWTATIKFDANGGTGTMDDATTEVTDSGEVEITLKSNSYTYEGYRFKRWNTKSDGSGTKYDDKAKIKIKQGEPTITLYAIWDKIDEWSATIKYNGNGGTGAIADQSTTVKDVDSAELKLADITGITREGYIFNGWNTKADGSGTAYSAGGTMTVKMDNRTVEVFAQWKNATTGAVAGDATAAAANGAKANGAPAVGSPQTSDATDFITPIILMVLSLAGIVFVLKDRLFKSKQQ